MKVNCTVVLAAALLAGCGGTGMSIPAGGAVSEGFEPDIPAEMPEPTPVPEAGAEPEFTLVAETPEPLVLEPEPPSEQEETTPGEEGIPIVSQEDVQAAPTAGQKGKCRDIVVLSYEKALSGAKEDTYYCLTNRFLLSRSVPWGEYPLETTIFMEQVGEAAIGGRVDRVSGFVADNPYTVHMHRLEYNKFMGYNLGLEYNQFNSMAHWLQSHLRVGVWFIKGRLYASGGIAYRRIFPSWSDFFDNALASDETRWSFDARLVAELGEGGLLDCRAFLEGQAVDATADQGLAFVYHPIPELGVAFVTEKESHLLLGKVEDVGVDITYAAGRFFEIGVKWRSRDYATAGDRDDILGVQLSIRM